MGELRPPHSGSRDRTRSSAPILPVLRYTRAGPESEGACAKAFTTLLVRTVARDPSGRMRGAGRRRLDVRDPLIAISGSL